MLPSWKGSLQLFLTHISFCTIGLFISDDWNSAHKWLQNLWIGRDCYRRMAFQVECAQNLLDSVKMQILNQEIWGSSEILHFYQAPRLCCYILSRDCNFSCKKVQTNTFLYLWLMRPSYLEEKWEILLAMQILLIQISLTSHSDHLW